MWSAFFWGLVGGVSLLLGAALVYLFEISDRVLGAIMAFGAGVLISAVSFELVQEATNSTDGDWSVALGLFAGAMTFFIGDFLIDRAGGKNRKSNEPQQSEEGGTAILLGTVLDGVPESIVIGLSLIGGGTVSAAMVSAVFLSNIPEAVSSTSGLRASGWSAKKLFGMWSGVALVAGISSLAGFTLFDSASDELVAFVQAFAGGALLTMLADTMMPQAFKLDGKTAGLLTTLGFGVAYAISAF
jgi:ZIP family zinc transporter